MTRDTIERAIKNASGAGQKENYEAVRYEGYGPAGIAVIGAITGELFAGSSRVGEGGLGYSILYASGQLETDYLFALVFAAAVLGFVFFFVGMFLEWYFLHNWHESSRSSVSE